MQIHPTTLCEVKDNRSWFYFAYGSNINRDQMALRCPTAEYRGHWFLRGWNLVFERHANIVPQRGGRVPGVIWRVRESDIEALDAYEGLGYYYRRREWRQDGNSFFFYEMLESSRGGSPSINYLEGIAQGYRQCGLDQKYLLQRISLPNYSDIGIHTSEMPKASATQPKLTRSLAS
jgi:hypothetical protein